MSPAPAAVAEPYKNDASTNFRDPKIMREFVNDKYDENHNIPAVLPYEAKVAILREISRDDRQLEPEMSDRAKGKSGKPRVEGLSSPDDDEKLDEHFFYANSPIMDYKLSDGSKGSVPQVPRR